MISNEPVPSFTTRPTTSLEDGESRESFAPVHPTHQQSLKYLSHLHAAIHQSLTHLQYSHSRIPTFKKDIECTYDVCSKNRPYT